MGFCQSKAIIMTARRQFTCGVPLAAFACTGGFPTSMQYGGIPAPYALSQSEAELDAQASLVGDDHLS